MVLYGEMVDTRTNTGKIKLVKLYFILLISLATDVSSYYKTFISLYLSAVPSSIVNIT